MPSPTSSRMDWFFLATNSLIPKNNPMDMIAEYAIPKNGFIPSITRISPAIKIISRRSNFNKNKLNQIDKNMPSSVLVVYFIQNQFSNSSSLLDNRCIK